MSTAGFTSTKGTVGANSQNKNDGISAILVSGVAIAGTLALGVTYKITQVKDAEALGITAAYDSANNVRIYRHIFEFYRMGGEGIDMYIMIYPQNITPVAALGDTYGRKLIADARGAVRIVGLIFNPPAGYTPTYVDGMESMIRLAIPELQNFADWTDQTFRPVHTILECRGINVGSSAALNLRAMTVANIAVEYNQVSLCIAQDWDYADTQDAIGQKFADVGTLMGALAGRQVNENPGEVGVVNLTDTKSLKWLTAGISNHAKTTTIETDLDEWDDKGYILAWDYLDENVSGFRFSDDKVCAPVRVDALGNMNENSIALSRTNIKVRRSIRSVYLPKVKSVVQVATDTGLLPLGRIKALEGLGNDVFKRMASDGIISGGLTTVDKNSNLLVGDKILNVGYRWVPTGTIGAIAGIVNIKTTLS